MLGDDRDGGRLEDARIIGALSKTDWFAGIRYGACVMSYDEPKMEEFWLPDENVLGGWCEIHVKGWNVPFLATSHGSLEDGCIEEAVRSAMRAFGVVLDQDTEVAENAPQEPSHDPTGTSGDDLVTEAERTELNNLIVEVAMLRNVSFGTVKAALMKSPAAREAGIANGSELSTSRQAQTLMRQLRTWIKVSQSDE